MFSMMSVSGNSTNGTVTVPFILLPDTDIIENICENEKDLEHIFFKK